MNAATAQDRALRNLTDEDRGDCPVAGNAGAGE
jgi:hypothetical protein